VLLAEVLHDPRCHVLGVVEDVEGATLLGSETVGDRGVAVLDRQRDRLVRSSQGVGSAPAGGGLVRGAAAARSQERRSTEAGGDVDPSSQDVSSGQLRPRPPTAECWVVRVETHVNLFTVDSSADLICLEDLP
jgi:hypothetical protein